MLFEKLNQVLASTVETENQINAEIEALEAKLAELRLEVAKNKERQQRQTTLIGSFQSALVQVIKAVSAANENKELIEAFWQEIDAIKSCGEITLDLAGFLPESPDSQDSEDDPKIDPNIDLDEAIDISLGIIEDQIIDSSHDHDFSPGEDMNPEIQESTLTFLKTLKITELRKVGSKLGVKGASRLNRADLEDQLSGFELPEVMITFQTIYHQ